MDDGADGLVQRRTDYEARQVVGGGLERRRVEAEAAAEDLRAQQRRHLQDGGEGSERRWKKGRKALER